jgi:hypothetical protein
MIVYLKIFPFKSISYFLDSLLVIFYCLKDICSVEVSLLGPFGIPIQILLELLTKKRIK